MKRYLLASLQIVLDLLLIPVYFFKIFVDTAILPGYDLQGNFITKKFNYYYSPLTNLKALDAYFVFIIQLALIGLSVIFAIISVIKYKKSIFKYLSCVFFAITLLFFLFALIYASTVARGY